MKFNKDTKIGEIMEKEMKQLAESKDIETMLSCKKEEKIKKIENFIAKDNLLELKEKHLSKCNLLGILRTIYDPMQLLASRISHELEDSFKDLLFATKISYNPKISESSSAACPVLVYDRTSLGSREYLSFAGEILKKLRQLQ